MQTDSSATDALDPEQLLAVMKRLQAGELTAQLPAGLSGTSGEIADVFNRHVQMMNQFAAEMTHVTREMGTESKYGGQMEVPGLTGTWNDLLTNTNTMSGNITLQFREVARQVTSIANGDLSRHINTDMRGEMDELKQTLNVFADQMNRLTAEVTRVAREVGTDGRFGPQAEVRGASGFWKKMVDEVNIMAASLTDQIRDIGNVMRGVALGDMSRRLSCRADGEMAEIQKSINGIIESKVVGQDR